MQTRDDAITISGLSVAVSPDAIATLIGKRAGPVNVELQLAGLNVRAPQAALDQILAAVLSQDGDGETDIQVGVTSGSISVSLTQSGRSIAISIPLNRLALSIEDGGVSVTGE